VVGAVLPSIELAPFLEEKEEEEGWCCLWRGMVPSSEKNRLSSPAMSTPAISLVLQCSVLQF